MIRRVVCLLAFSLAFGIVTSAQNTADVYLGYSYTRQQYGNGIDNFNMNGGIGQITFSPKWIGLVAEFGGSNVSTLNGLPASGQLYSYMGGPRISFRHGPLQPYIQGLFGGAHITSSLQTALGSTSANSFAMAVGGGLDLKMSRHFAVRLAQVDYFMTNLTNPASVRFTQNNFRYSGGIVFRF